MSVPSYTLKSGYKIPAIALGVYKTPLNEATKLVRSALNVGYRHIDCAQFYKNEKEVIGGIGEWIKENPDTNKRSDIFYTTKIFDHDHGYELTKAAVQRSLDNMKEVSSYLDLVLIHSPQSNEEKRLGSWRALQEFAEAGSIHTIGVSNYGIHHLEELYAWKGLKIEPAVNQVELHPWLMRNDLVHYCRSKGILLEAYSPMARGQKFDKDENVIKLSEKYNKSQAQIMIKWSLQQGFITLPKTSNPKRLASNFDVFSFELSKEDVDLLSQPESYYISGWDPTTYDK